MKVNGLKANSPYEWVEVCKFGQMDLDMRVIGKKARLGDQEG